jgi:plastocyanin
VAAGFVLHPLHRRAPIALSADLGGRPGAPAGERLAWSAGLQAGVSHTPHTLSLFATNTGSGTVQGASRGEARPRFGLQFTALVPAGGFLGWFAPRERAAEAVRTDVDAPAGVHAEIVRYLYAPKRLVIPAGTTVEWTNRDEVVHTVSANDGSWDSGAIRPGASWRATFSAPGIYPYHCGPHPFMQGVVEVR